MRFGCSPGSSALPAERVPLGVGKVMRLDDHRPNITKIALIGFGRMGQAMAADLRRAGVGPVSVFDTAFHRPASPQALALRVHTVQEFASVRGAVADARVVMSCVGREMGLEAALTAAAGIEPGAFFLDFADASEADLLRGSQAIAQAGGLFVPASAEGARGVAGLRLAGPHAVAAADAIRRLGIALNGLAPARRRAA